LISGAALLASSHEAPPVAVQITAPDPALSLSARRAVETAARLEQRQIVLEPAGVPLALKRSAGQQLDLHFGAGFPLSSSGKAMVAAAIERDVLMARSGGRAPVIRSISETAAGHGTNPAQIGHFAMVMLLWLVLTGSLGMLLQSVARERSNRSLESLLAAARPWQIMAGKLTGVGAVSLVVVAVWLGAAALFGGLLAKGNGFVALAAAAIVGPQDLARALFAYLFVYVFYGTLTIGVGALARDAASAQNLARPLFVTLLAVFLVVLASVASESTGLFAWLVYLPPFTPFVLLLVEPGTLSPLAQGSALFFLIVAAAAAALFASRQFALPGARSVGNKWIATGRAAR
jgi:ABC-type Na+ efflux pump permease subunit